MLHVALALASPPDWAAIAASYPSMPVVADVAATPGAAFLCRMPTPGVDTFHHNTHLRVHANAVAREAFAQASGERSFPEGAVIVKVKLDAGSHGLNGIPALGAPPVHAGIGVMVKREAGFAPDAGDWQYALVEDGKVYDQPDEVGHCAACHTHGKLPDGVQAPQGNPNYLGNARDAVFLSEAVREVAPSAPPAPR